MNRFSRSPNCQNYNQNQPHINYKVIEPLTNERGRSMVRNNIPGKLNAQKQYINKEQPNYNRIPVHKDIFSKKIYNSKKIFQPNYNKNNNTFENVNFQKNFKENNYMIQPSENIQNLNINQNENQFFLNQQNVTQPYQEIKKMNNQEAHPGINYGFNQVIDGQFGQANRPKAPQIINNEFQLMIPRNKPFDNQVINKERNDEIPPGILTINKNDKTNFNKDFITNNIKYLSNNTNFENELKMANKKIEELLEKNKNLQNQLDEEKKINCSINLNIQKLKESIKEKDKDLLFLKNQLEILSKSNKKISMYERDDMLSVNFICTNPKIEYAIPCVKNDIFAVVEEKLYEIFPKCRDTNNNFLYKNKQILRFKTISQNNIIDGSPVYLKIVKNDKT